MCIFVSEQLNKWLKFKYFIGLLSGSKSAKFKLNVFAQRANASARRVHTIICLHFNICVLRSNILTVRYCSRKVVQLYTVVYSILYSVYVLKKNQTEENLFNSMPH